jgi:DNA polymerase lambda
VKKAYVEGRDKDPFKMKAIDRGVHQLSSLGKALDTDEDVDLVPDLGPKTAAKVKEILARGSSSRLEAARGDEQLQVAPAGRGMLACPTAGALPLNLCPCAACSFYEHPTAATSRIPPLQALNQFMEVWGVGSATAQRWYALGCRSLEDVRARAQELRLSEFQEASLRHFNDLLVKIPRDEVARAEAVVREAFFELAGGCSPNPSLSMPAVTCLCAYTCRAFLDARA